MEGVGQHMRFDILGFVNQPVLDYKPTFIKLGTTRMFRTFGNCADVCDLH